MFWVCFKLADSHCVVCTCASVLYLAPILKVHAKKVDRPQVSLQNLLASNHTAELTSLLDKLWRPMIRHRRHQRNIFSNSIYRLSDVINLIEERNVIGRQPRGALTSLHPCSASDGDWFANQPKPTPTSRVLPAKISIEVSAFTPWLLDSLSAQAQARRQRNFAILGIDSCLTLRGMVRINYDCRNDSHHYWSMLYQCNICWGRGSERKKRIAEGLGCRGPHDVCRKECWSSVQKSKCLVWLFGPLNNFIFTHVTRHAEISIWRMIYKRERRRNLSKRNGAVQ